MSYTAIASITLGSSATTVEFSSIPQDYRDLILVGDFKTNGNDFSFYRLNNDAGNAFGTRLTGFSGGSITTGSLTRLDLTPTNSTTRSYAIIQVMDYSATDKHKICLVRDAEIPLEMDSHGHRYASTAGVTSLTLLTTASTGFSTGSTFSLYGIAS